MTNTNLRKTIYFSETHNSRFSNLKEYDKLPNENEYLTQVELKDLLINSLPSDPFHEEIKYPIEIPFDKHCKFILSENVIKPLDNSMYESQFQLDFQSEFNHQLVKHIFWSLLYWKLGSKILQNNDNNKGEENLDLEAIEFLKQLQTTIFHFIKETYNRLFFKIQPPKDILINKILYVNVYLVNYLYCKMLVPKKFELLEMFDKRFFYDCIHKISSQTTGIFISDHCIRINIIRIFYQRQFLKFVHETNVSDICTEERDKFNYITQFGFQVSEKKERSQSLQNTFQSTQMYSTPRKLNGDLNSTRNSLLDNSGMKFLQKLNNKNKNQLFANNNNNVELFEDQLYQTLNSQFSTNLKKERIEKIQRSIQKNIIQLKEAEEEKINKQEEEQKRIQCKIQVKNKNDPEALLFQQTQIAKYQKNKYLEKFNISQTSPCISHAFQQLHSQHIPPAYQRVITHPKNKLFQNDRQLFQGMLAYAQQIGKKLRSKSHSRIQAGSYKQKENQVKEADVYQSQKRNLDADLNSQEIKMLYENAISKKYLKIPIETKAITREQGQRVSQLRYIKELIESRQSSYDKFKEEKREEHEEREAEKRERLKRLEMERKYQDFLKEKWMKEKLALREEEQQMRLQLQNRKLQVSQKRNRELVKSKSILSSPKSKQKDSSLQSPLRVSQKSPLKKQNEFVKNMEEQKIFTLVKEQGRVSLGHINLTGIYDDKSQQILIQKENQKLNDSYINFQTRKQIFQSKSLEHSNKIHNLKTQRDRLIPYQTEEEIFKAMKNSLLNNQQFY